jgi:hypothetical protein
MPKQPESASSVPPKLAATTPPYGQDFSYLEIVMELQKSMAAMSAKLDHLADSSKSYDAKLDAHSEKMRDKVEGLAKDIHAAKVLATVLGAIVTIVIAVIGYIAIPILFKILDVVSALLKAH